VYKRTKEWLEEKQRRLKMEQRKKKKEEMKGVSFHPNIRATQSSKLTMPINDTHSTITDIGGVQKHLQRIMEAKRIQMQKAEAFLLPSQKKKLK
jgi:hypothetical protein